MTKEAKVGAFTLAGILLLVLVVAHLSGFRLGGNDGYCLYVGFTKATGLVPQSSVCLSGVPVGSVESIENEGTGVTVAIRVKEGVRVPRDSTVTIESTGVMGEKFVSIMPGKGDSHLFENGDYIIGQDEEGMDAMFLNISKAVVQVQELLSSVNEIISDPQLKGTLVDMAVNMRDASAHVNGLMAGLEQMVYMNQGNVQQTVQNLQMATAGMQRTMNSVEHMMANLDTVAGDPQTAENIRMTLQNIADTSVRVERMAASIEGVVSDPQTAEDLKQTIHNARTLTDKADKMLGKVGGIQVKP
ncbi:MAG: MCE family protein, partial [Selenomonadaceae bacterium]|nr:MCE family protein [Selenomonadaceae bacterium]